MYDRNILVEQTDPEIFAAIQAENARQEQHIELIASENCVVVVPQRRGSLVVRVVVGARSAGNDVLVRCGVEAALPSCVAISQCCSHS